MQRLPRCSKFAQAVPRLFPVWVVLAGGLALWRPELFTWCASSASTPCSPPDACLQTRTSRPEPSCPVRSQVLASRREPPDLSHLALFAVRCLPPDANLQI
eukprot:358664-Chlamydomonas_euryale.AAC.1